MSADNGIYIHKFKDGYRVVHAQAIENIYWKKGKNKYNYRILKDYFKESPIFKTKSEAIVYAFDLNKKIDYETEYGICEVQGVKMKEFVQVIS